MVYKGISLLSGVDPIRRCERAADAVPVRERTLYLCPSPLYGYGLLKLASRLEKEAPDSAILCVEAESELCGIFEEHFDHASFGNKIKYIKLCGFDNEIAAGKICVYAEETWGKRAFRRIETVKLTGGRQLHPQLYASLEQALRQEIATNWSNALTLTKLGRLYIKNFLRNLTLLCEKPSISELSFNDSLVLVLGAGPSLDETICALTSRFSGINNRNFKIICVDTCLSSLLERNIIPDLVIILESQHWNLRDFIGLKNLNINFAIDLTALPATAHILREGFLFFTPWTELKIFERLKNEGLLPALMPPLGSVGLTATEIARRLTKGNIICAGLDFSFMIDKFHARGTPAHKSRLNKQSRTSGLINNAVFNNAFSSISKSGEKVLSSPVMRNYRDLFEREFSSDPRLFTICDSGLSLGIKTFSVNEAMDMLCNTSAKAEKHCNNYTEFFNEEKKTMLKEKLLIFIKEEQERLNSVKSMLSGESAMDEERLNSLINECDYLFAHFPDYAGNSGAEIQYTKNQSFLNRLRTELEPMIKLLVRNLI